MTVDCIELNETTVAESASPRQNNEIIIAVPTVSSTNERKTATTKRAAIISFEEDENASVINNNVLKSSTPPTTTTTTVSLADACLKYQEKQKLSEEKPKPFETDSTYERLHAEPINVVPVPPHPSETDYIEPESPTAITIINPITHAYASLSNSYDYKETDSSMSKADSSSITSSTTTHSSNSPPNQAVSRQPSHSTSMNSSICSAHNSPDTTPNTPNAILPSPESEFTSRLHEIATVESQHIYRIQELERRCASLEEQVSTLTL